MVDLGAQYTVAVDVRDAAGALVDPGAAVLTITLPDGTITSPIVTLPAAVPGELRVDYLPVQVGRHAWRMVTTSPATSYGDVFDVDPYLSGGITSLAETKAHLNIKASDTSNDVKLRRFIGATTRTVEKLRGEAIVRRTVVERFTLTSPVRKVVLSTVPVLTLTSIESLDRTGTWSMSGFDLDAQMGAVTVLPGTRMLAGFMRFTYDAGYVIVPEAFRLASLIIIAHLWETQRGRQGVVVGGEMEPGYGPGFAVPNRALELLGGSLPGVA